MKKVLSILIAVTLLFAFSFGGSAVSLGDVDGDGKISAADARIVLRTAVHLEDIQPGTEKYNACDIDGSKSVTAADARIVLRIAVALETIESYTGAVKTVPSNNSNPSGGSSSSGSSSSGKSGSSGSNSGTGTRAVPDPAKNDQTVTYVVNTNTGKFHYPTCKSVPKIKRQNRTDSTATRSELIAAGYSPCGNCKP